MDGLQSRLHRLDGRPIRNVTQLVSFIADRRIVMETGRSALPTLAEAAVGRVITGSWMADSEVHHIYRLLNRLPTDKALRAPLVLGKETVISYELAPVVDGLARDGHRRAAALTRLSSLSRKLLDDVETTGAVRMDRWHRTGKEARAARYELQRSLLAWSEEMHTERGAHTAIVRPWTSSPIAEAAGTTTAEATTADEAADRLFDAALHSAVMAPEREARRWFEFLPVSPLDRAVDDGRAIATSTKPVVIAGAEYC